MKLRTARQRAKLTQAELGAKSGVGQWMISRLESGRAVRPRITVVKKLAKVLKVGLEQLDF